MDIIDKVAKNIIDVCKKENISYSKLASLSGLSEERVNKILTIGSKRKPSLDEIHKIALGLNVSLDSLLRIK